MRRVAREEVLSTSMQQMQTGMWRQALLHPHLRLQRKAMDTFFKDVAVIKVGSVTSNDARCC